MHISSIFYFSKSTSINTQYSNLWDTLMMMLFSIKILNKMTMLCRISWKFQYRFYSKLSIEVEIGVILVQCPFKGTNGRQKTYEIFHVYCIFYSGFMCQTTVIFGITKDGSLVLNTLASWNCFTCRNLFQNGANDMSECLTCETAFCKKAQNFV